MSTQHPADDAELSIVGHRHYGRWFSALIVLLIVGIIANSMLHNPRFEWAVVAENFTEASIINGVIMTLKLTVISVIFGFAGGVLLALMRLSANPVLVAVSWLIPGSSARYRCWCNFSCGTTSPRSIRASAVDSVSGQVASAPTNTIISTFSAAVIALVMHQSAYAAEIVRAGIQSVGSGQLEAAKALGYRRGQILWRVVLPQAMRTILPPAGDEVMGSLKPPPWCRLSPCKTCCIRRRLSTNAPMR